MKKLLALVLAALMAFALAACGEEAGASQGGSTGKNSGGEEAAGFTGTYVYAPPADNYYIAWGYFDADGSTDGTVDIFARIGQGHTEAVAGAGIYHASEDMQLYYERAWEGEYASWMQSPGYGYSDWKSDYEEFGPSLGSCDDMEAVFMRYFRAYGYDDSKLQKYYVGTETVCGISCWVFDSKGLNGIQCKYWIDPSNGLCLKSMDTTDGTYAMVTAYDLNYTQWTDNLAPATYEGIS